MDILAAICVAVFAWTGWSTGLVYQVGHLVTLLISAVIARAMVVPIAYAMLEIRADDVDGAVGRVFLGCFAVVYGLFWWAVRRLTRELRDVDMRGPGDQVMGILAGAGRGALFAVILAVGYMAVTFGDRGDAAFARFTATRVGETAERNDFLERPALSLAEKLDASTGGQRRAKEWDVYGGEEERQDLERSRGRGR